MPKGIRPHCNKDLPEKKCTACHKWFPRTSEHFYKNVRAYDSFMSACKKCIGKRREEFKKEHPVYLPPSHTKDAMHENYLEHKQQGMRRKYKINRYIKEGKLPKDFVDQNPDSKDCKLIPKTI